MLYNIYFILTINAFDLKYQPFIILYISLLTVFFIIYL